MIILHAHCQKCCCADQVLRITGRDFVSSQTIRLRAWVDVTHETKDIVMEKVAPEDLKAIGCKNPDIHIVSKKDDRVVLTTPATLRRDTGKSKKHVTNVRASEIFGETWPERLPILKLEKVGHLMKELSPRYSQSLIETDAYATFYRVGSDYFVVIHGIDV